MFTYIAILRGINVSGKRLIKMNALQTLFFDLGFTSVETYIQSGNVVFKSSNKKSEQLAELISTGIQKQFGHDVPVLVLNADTLKNIITKNPFLADPTKDQAYFHITFLNDVPAQELIAKLSPSAYSPDKFIYSDHAIYVYCPNGYGNTKLTNTFFETKLKVGATTRNWKTSLQLLEMAEKLYQ